MGSGLKERLKLGIRAQLIAGIVVTTIAGIGLIGILSIKIVENSFVFGKIAEAERIVKIIRIASRTQLSDDTVRFIGLSLKESGVNSFRINGPGGKTLISSGRMEDGDGESVYLSDVISVKRIGGGWFRGAGRSLHVTAPLDSGALSRNTLEFAVPLSEIAEGMASVRRFLIIYAALDSLIIIALGVYFLSGSIIRPVRELEEAAKRLAGGKLGERADVKADNEIGSLAASFNTMAERLESEIKSLERVNIELLTAQEELTRSSTLAAVGRLAAGIAHEIGNPLGAVRGYIDILSSGVGDKEEEKEIFRRASMEASRIDAIVREFLDVARPSRKAAEPLDVNSVVEDTLASVAVRGEFAGVNIKKSLENGLPKVSIEEGKLRQVLMNLVINAAQALAVVEADKTITIESWAEKRPFERRMKRRKDDPPLDAAEYYEREFVLIRVKDNGSGISEEDSKKVFDPFFTTKEVGKGTGLGLFVSQTIIKACGGSITLEPKPGAGSSFVVALPAEKRLLI